MAAMGGELARSGNHYPGAAPSNTFECKDGLVYVMVVLDAHWKTLAGVIGHPDLADDPEFATREKRWANVEACDALVAAWMSERSRAEAIEALNRAGVAIAPVNTYAEAARDPHVLERDMLQPVRLEDGSTAPITGPAAKFSRTPTRVRTGPPGLGQHNEEILAEIGLDQRARERLRQMGIA